MASSTHGWVAGDWSKDVWSVLTRIRCALLTVAGKKPGSLARSSVAWHGAVVEAHAGFSSQIGYFTVLFYDGDQCRKMFVHFDLPRIEHKFTEGPALLFDLGDNGNSEILIQKMLGQFPECVRWYRSTTLMDDNVQSIGPREGRFDYSLNGLTIPPPKERRDQGWDVRPNLETNQWHVHDWDADACKTLDHDGINSGIETAMRAGVSCDGNGLLLDRQCKALPVNEEVATWLQHTIKDHTWPSAKPSLPRNLSQGNSPTNSAAPTSST